MPEAIAAFWAEYGHLLITGTMATLSMTAIATLFAYLFGLPMGVILVITRSGGIRPNRVVSSILGWIVNIGRSLPFIILIVAVIPLTRAVMGTSIHVRGAIFPLVLASAPFVARMVESSLSEVDSGVIEAAQSMGATTLQIVFKVYLPEALPSLVLGASISLISILSYTAIAGVVGAGGLGDIAKRYGYERNETAVMWVTVVLLIILVQIVQSLFSFFSQKIDKRVRH